MANNPRFIGLGKRSAWLAIPALFVAYVPLWAGEPQATLSALPPDYAVYNDEAGMVCLQAARTGKLLDRNGDASSILQKAIDLLPASGGKVYVAGGNYRLSRTLVIRDRHGVHLEGVARNAVNTWAVLAGAKELVFQDFEPPVRLWFLHKLS